MIETMEDLFIRAEQEHLWFYTSYQNLWFSPAELRAAQADGSFRWGATNWRLRPPSELRTQAKRKVAEAIAELAAVVERIEGPQ